MFDATTMLRVDQNSRQNAIAGEVVLEAMAKPQIVGDTTLQPRLELERSCQTGVGHGLESVHVRLQVRHDR